MASKPKIDPKKTTMIIKEVVLIEEGQNKGGLAINVVATRNKKEYQLPYLIAAHSVPSFDFDNFMIKVRSDVDNRENEHSKAMAVADQLKGLMTAPIALD